MNIKRIVGVLVTLLMGFGYYALSHQTSDNGSTIGSQSAATIHVSAGTAGLVTDTRPSEQLAMTVLTDRVRQALNPKSLSFNKAGAFIVNDNKTDLNASVSSAPYVNLSKVDSLNRPQQANALLSKSSREYRNRQETGNSRTINPVGWQQMRLTGGKTLYNRGHLIGYALAGGIRGFDASEANPQNIATQTAWANQASNGNDANTGQNYYETLIRKRLDASRTVKIRYKVTPIYDGDNLVPSGNHLEAKANDGSLEYNVFVPNVQPGVIIDYKTGFAKVAQ